MTPEGRIKRKVSALLKSFGDKVWYFMPVKHPRFGNKSLDYICCVSGEFVAIETKKDVTSRLTELQKITRKTIEEAGGIVFVVYDEISLDYLRLHISSRIKYANPHIQA